MMLRAAFRPDPGSSRLRESGDLTAARRAYESHPSRNLLYLLRQRYEWCNDHVGADDRGVEFAAGIGASRDFVRCRSLVLTDIEGGDWLDVVGVDATHTPFADGAFDFVLVSNAIHHLAHPTAFFAEAHRILRPGGLVLIRDVTCSLLQRLAARVTRVEGYDYDVDPFDPTTPMCDPDDPWSANNAVPDLLFDDLARFQEREPRFEVLLHRHDECLVFLNSGGVTHKTPHVPLPERALDLLSAIDQRLTQRWPATFALQRSVVLRAR
jgi:SAM-dependent methyltransferase